MKLSVIDKDLNIYKNHNVVLFGIGSAGYIIYKKLKHFNIPVYAVSDNNPKYKDGNKILFDEDTLPFISPKNLIFTPNLLVQITSSYNNEIYSQLINLGITNIIAYGEAEARLNKLELLHLPNNFVDAYIKNYNMFLTQLTLKNLYKFTINKFQDSTNIVCLPPKTADFTILHTVNTLNSDLLHLINTYHSPDILTDEEFTTASSPKKIKLITAVRDPISQNLSSLMQYLGEPSYFFYDCEESWIGEDITLLFRIFLELEGYMPKTHEYSTKCSYYKYNHDSKIIQIFWERLIKNIGNIYDYDFDKTAGYSIINIGKYEIFIYQLEKLTAIQKHLFEWLGMPEKVLKNENVGDEKWYAPAYKAARKELTFSQEYFDKCFNEPYVKHFYSESDIAKFKEKWRSHIR